MATFLKSLLSKQNTRTTSTIEHDGVKFMVKKMDLFTQQALAVEADARAEKWMNSIAPKAWKDQPGKTQGKSKWDEQFEEKKQTETTILAVAHSLHQADGSPVFTSDTEREEFLGYLAAETTLWNKVIAAWGEEKKTEAPSVKKGPRKK